MAAWVGAGSSCDIPFLFFCFFSCTLNTENLHHLILLRVQTLPPWAALLIPESLPFPHGLHNGLVFSPCESQAAVDLMLLLTMTVAEFEIPQDKRPSYI